MKKAMQRRPCPRGRQKSRASWCAASLRWKTAVCPASWPTAREKDPTKTEIYIVEGDSAGGSAKMGARFQNSRLSCPLWGKMLNVEKARSWTRSTATTSLLPVVTGAGLRHWARSSTSPSCATARSFIMADADVDGSHIRTLLLTFFFRYHAPAD